MLAGHMHTLGCGLVTLLLQDFSEDSPLKVTARKLGDPSTYGVLILGFCVHMYVTLLFCSKPMDDMLAACVGTTVLSTEAHIPTIED